MHSECVLACRSGAKCTQKRERERNPISSGSVGRACSSAVVPFVLGVGKSLLPRSHLPGDLAPVPPSAITHCDGKPLLRIVMQTETVITMMEERQVKLLWRAEESSWLRGMEEDV